MEENGGGGEFYLPKASDFSISYTNPEYIAYFTVPSGGTWSYIGGLAVYFRRSEYIGTSGTLLGPARYWQANAYFTETVFSGGSTLSARMDSNYSVSASDFYYAGFVLVRVA